MRWILLLFTLVSTGCLSEPTRECLGSNECADGQVCRAGACLILGANATDDTSDAIQTPLAPPDTGRSARDVTTQTPDDTGLDAEDVETIDAALDADSAEPACPGGLPPGIGELRINEVLANPPSESSGDANRDGVRDAFEDEFVEIVNMTPRLLDLSGVRVSVDDKTKVLMDGNCLPPREGIVVFGGYRGEGAPISPRGSLAIVSFTRLGLSNSGAQVEVTGPSGVALDRISYTDAPAEALTRSPQLHGSDLQLHSSLHGGRLMSPGQCADGSLLPTECVVEETPADAGSDSGAVSDADVDAGD